MSSLMGDDRLGVDERSFPASSVTRISRCRWRRRGPGGAGRDRVLGAAIRTAPGMDSPGPV